MQCVVSLTIQFMLIYTALAICRMAADSFGLKYDNLPIQKILQTATLTVAFAPMLAILFLTLIVCVIPLFTGETINVDPKTGEIPSDAEPFKSQACAIAFTALKYLILIMLYGGVLAVIYGICTYEPPPQTFEPG